MTKITTIGERFMMSFPDVRIRTARKAHRCDYMLAGGLRCTNMITAGDQYLDPGDSNPESAGGFGGFRYCAIHAGDPPETSHDGGKAAA